jgi:hypothetical protein
MYKSKFTGLNVDDILSKIKDPIVLEVSKSESFKLINHELNKYPIIKLINSNGEELFCNKYYKDKNTILVNWKTPFDGLLIIGE